MSMNSDLIKSDSAVDKKAVCIQTVFPILSEFNSFDRLVYPCLAIKIIDLKG